VRLNIPSGRPRPTAGAAVFIGAPPDAHDGADTLLPTLICAETRVLASLFAGPTLAETAANPGIAGDHGENAPRTLRRGHGQAELTRVWAGLISSTGSNM
jgi:hypothetical protein